MTCEYWDMGLSREGPLNKAKLSNEQSEALACVCVLISLLIQALVGCDFRRHFLSIDSSSMSMYIHAEHCYQPLAVALQPTKTCALPPITVRPSCPPFCVTAIPTLASACSRSDRSGFLLSQNLYTTIVCIASRSRYPKSTPTNVQSNAPFRSTFLSCGESKRACPASARRPSRPPPIPAHSRSLAAALLALHRLCYAQKRV